MHKKYFDLSEILQNIDVHIENIESSISLQSLTRKKEDETINESASLFKHADDAETYLTLLKKTTPPILNEKGEYIFGEHGKSSITIFFDVLQRKGITNYLRPDLAAKVINSLIPNLKTTSRTLQNFSERAERFRCQFEKLISAV